MATFEEVTKCVDERSAFDIFCGLQPGLGSSKWKMDPKRYQALGCWTMGQPGLVIGHRVMVPLRLKACDQCHSTCSAGIGAGILAGCYANNRGGIM